MHGGKDEIQESASPVQHQGRERKSLQSSTYIKDVQRREKVCSSETK